jgi:hypothetical protein
MRSSPPRRPRRGSPVAAGSCGSARAASTPGVEGPSRRRRGAATRCSCGSVATTERRMAARDRRTRDGRSQRRARPGYDFPLRSRLPSTRRRRSGATANDSACASRWAAPASAGTTPRRRWVACCSSEGVRRYTEGDHGGQTGAGESTARFARGARDQGSHSRPASLVIGHVRGGVAGSRVRRRTAGLAFGGVGR